MRHTGAGGQIQSLFPDDFYKNSFLSAAVELAVKDLFPGAEVQFSSRDGQEGLPAHQLAF